MAVLTLTVYIIGLILVLFYNRNNRGSSIFRVSKKTSWFVSGLSLLMFSYSATLGHFAYGTIQESGIQGMWIIWVGFLGSGIVPFVFAPLWRKLNLETDNQFVLLRFSGSGARFLQIFRALFVGGIIVPMILSMHMLAFATILSVYTQLDMTSALMITGGILALFSLKNTIQIKLAHDAYHAALYFVGLGIIFMSFHAESGGLVETIQQIRSTSPEMLSVFPSPERAVLWNSLLVLFGIQWWSSQLTDGGGPEMARFTAIKNHWDVVKAAAMPMVLILVIDLLFIMMILMSLSIQNAQGESGWIQSVFGVIPPGSIPFILLVFFILFITTAESFLNWGASLLTVDYYKTKVNPQISARGAAIVGISVMVCLSILSTVLSIWSESVSFVVSLFLSVTTGVSPILLLRWFWMRINAWTQFSAMLGSLVYTFILIILEQQHHPIYGWFSLQAHETRIVLVTIFTTITWFTVMVLTRPDTAETLQKFREFMPDRSEIIRNLAIALVFGLSILAVLVAVLTLIVR